MLKVRAISNEECKKYGSVVIHESHLCTFGPKGKLGGDGICSVSICKILRIFCSKFEVSQTNVLNVHSVFCRQGDSGGPLVKNGELVGITSWAVLCAKGYPDGKRASCI